MVGQKVGYHGFKSSKYLSSQLHWYSQRTFFRFYSLSKMTMKFPLAPRKIWTSPSRMGFQNVVIHLWRLLRLNQKPLNLPINPNSEKYFSFSLTSLAKSTPRYTIGLSTIRIPWKLSIDFPLHVPPTNPPLRAFTKRKHLLPSPYSLRNVLIMFLFGCNIETWIISHVVTTSSHSPIEKLKPRAPFIPNTSRIVGNIPCVMPRRWDPLVILRRNPSNWREQQSHSTKLRYSFFLLWFI